MFITTLPQSQSLRARSFLILQGLGDMMEDVWLAAVILYDELFDNICIHTLHRNPLDTFPWNSLAVHHPLGFHAGLPACLALCDGDAGWT